MQELVFDCGCRFDVVGPSPNKGEIPSIKLNPDKISKDCPKTWDLISSGATKGVFQLESSLGKTWSKRIKPRTMEHLSAIGALLRPGCLRSMSQLENEDKPKSMTERFADRKNGIEPVDIFFDCIKDVLGETYGVLCVHEDTYISLSDGCERLIKDVVKNDGIISIDQSIYKCYNDNCHDIVVSPKTKGVRLVLSNGYSAILTDDHKVVTQRGSVQVKDLKDEDVVQVCVKDTTSLGHSAISNGQYDYISKNTSDVAYLVGQLIGDGCSGESICSGTEENHNILFQYLTSTFPNLRFTEYHHCRSWYIGISGDELVRSSEYGNRKTKYRIFVEELGLDKTKLDKIICDDILSLSDQDRRSFLAGLFDADGHSSNVVHYCSSNPQIVNAVRRLLSRDGIKTYISNDGKHLHVIDTISFDKLIGPHLHLKKIHTFYSGRQYGEFPRYLIRQKAKELGYSNLKKFANDNGLSDSCVKPQGFSTIETAEKCGFDFGDCAFCKVKSIEVIDEPMKFYSISVKNHHNFIANGIVINNCYQEQAMKIATIVAGFNDQEADKLRKAIGKKLPEEMAKVKTTFIDGAAKTNIVNQEQAAEIFGWIEKSQRYSFNKSHSWSYAENGYLSAFCKAHFPVQFYTSYLHKSKDKQNPHQEIRELVDDARRVDIDVMPPNLCDMEPHFHTDGIKVYFGLTDIKGVGVTQLRKLTQYMEDNKLTPDMEWVSFLAKIGEAIPSNVMEALIGAGALDYMGMTRKRMVYEMRKWNMLTAKEKEWMVKNSLNAKTLAEAISAGAKPKKEDGAAANKNRVSILQGIVKSLEQPPTSLEDTSEAIAWTEEKLLGISLTCSKIDGKDTSAVNCTCKEFIDGFTGMTIMAVEVTSVREITIKNGRNRGQRMAFLTITDGTCTLEDVVIFSESWAQYRGLLDQGNTVCVQGERDKKRGSLIVKKVWQI